MAAIRASFGPTPAVAQETSPGPAYGASAAVEGPIAARNPEDPTAGGTRIDVRGRGRALQDVGEALIEAPGTRVQNLGGLGAFSAVSLRGAELGHTSILLGAIPLTTADNTPFDLSYLALSALDTIEVYRGGAPAWYSEGAIGGVVRFVPAEAARDRLAVTAGTGSFGRREALATASVAGADGPRPSVLTHVRLAGADNDYPYIADGSTGFTATDDGERRQRNGAIVAGDGLLHASMDALGGRVSLLMLGHGRVQGVPGPLARATGSTQRKLVRALAGVSFEREAHDPDGARRYRLQIVGSGSHQHNSLTDLANNGELGTGQHDTDDQWQRGYLRLGGSYRVLSFLEATALASLQRDDYRPEDSGDAAISLAGTASGRTTAAASLEARLFGHVLPDVRAELRASTRQAWTETHVAFQDGLSKIDRRRDRIVATYRLAGVVEPIPGLSISTSVADGLRLPSAGDLFGDRTYLEPNPDLMPERALSSDLGAVLRGRVGAVAATLEVRGFALFVDDLIVYEQKSARLAQAKNVSSARILGLEAGLNLRAGGRFTLASSLTAMDTQNQHGRALPLRPPLQALLRPRLALLAAGPEQLSLFGELHHVAFTYLADLGTSTFPARTLLSLGATLSLWSDWLTLDVRVNNLLDARVSDALSRPLPGRDFRLSLTWALER